MMQEQDLWFLKSRTLWLQYSDKNSKFFHVSTLKRRSFTRIMGLKDQENNWCCDPSALSFLFLSYFKDLYYFSLLHSFYDSFSCIPQGPISTEDKWTTLCSPPSDLEIWSAIKAMKPWKAPGPDGLHAAFFQKFWNLIKDKVGQEIRLVFTSGTIPHILKQKLNFSHSQD
ncbi:hypothetical protein SLA2020_456740 [Shorea laevis]